MILDGFGSYMLVAPLALYLYDWLKPRRPGLVGLYTLCGLAYMLVGAMDAFMLAAALPPLINAYAQAAVPQRDTLQVVFSSLLNAVYLGLWNPLEVLVLGIWLLGLGPLIAHERPAIGRFTQLCGLAALLDAAGRLLNIEPLFTIGVGAFLLLFPLWLLGWGVDLLRRLPKRVESAPVL